MVSPAEALPQIRQLRIPGYGDDEITFFAETLFELAPSHIFEWGTNVGASARIFYELARVGAFACEVHTTEHPDHATHDHPGGRCGQLLKDCRVWMHTGDGLRRSLAEYAILGEPTRVLFFVDGDHSYDAVTRELEGIAEVVPTAVIIVHDTRHPLEETGAAVADFLIDGHHNYDVRWLESQAGMVRLWPRSA